MAPRPSSNPPPITKIEDGLYIGDITSSHKVDILLAHNITAIVSLTRGGLAYWRRSRNRELVPEENHYYLPCADTLTFDLLPHLSVICDFIERFRPRLRPDDVDHDHVHDDDDGADDASLPPGVLVHCEMGISRSATAVLAYLMRAYEWDFDTALAHFKQKRKVKPNPNFAEQLAVWAETKYEVWDERAPSSTSEDRDADCGLVPKAAYAAYLVRRAERLKELGLTGDEPVVPDL